MNRDIFTVIIQNEKTTESFLEHQSLFVDAINDQNVAVCKWNENGTNIDTALPELRSIINDTHLWRAIIVRYVDGVCMSKCKSKLENPYDFSTGDDSFVPSDVPLIRLTQMLGGVPPVCPTLDFDYKNVGDEKKSDKKDDSVEDDDSHMILRKKKFVYTPIYNEKEAAERKEREKSYGMDMRTPVSILIVSVRRDYNREVDVLDRSYGCRTEANSSKFWEINQYPSICRFLICDYINEGLLQREADEFNLWFSVMILATNVYKSDIIGAYKLYRLRTIWDKEKMTDSFQKTVNRLKDAENIIKEDLNKDFRYRSNLSEILPNLDVDIPVDIKMPGYSTNVNPSDMRMLAEGYGDLKKLDEKCEQIEDGYVASIKSTERNLDKSAESVRTNSFVDEREAKVLGKYQEEDLQNKIDDLFSRIVEQQNELPDGNFINEETYISKKTAVRDYLLRRVQRKDASLILAVTFLLAVLTSLFALFFKQSDGKPELFVVFLLIAVFGLVAFLSILIVLVAQKIKLNSLIKAFNKVVSDAYTKIVSNFLNYQEYVKNIASHSRGVSYLSWSKKKQLSISDIHEMRHAHVKAIAVMLKKLESWTKAYHLDVDFNAEVISQHVDVNVTIAPIENKMYAFEADMNYPVEVNNSGIMLKSPYNFACKIEICREELYDVSK